MPLWALNLLMKKFMYSNISIMAIFQLVVFPPEPFCRWQYSHITITKTSQRLHEEKVQGTWRILLLKVGFNRYPFQPPRSYKRVKDTKRTRVRLDRNVASCSRPTTSVIGPPHECKKVCPCIEAPPHSGIRA